MFLLLADTRSLHCYHLHQAGEVQLLHLGAHTDASLITLTLIGCSPHFWCTESMDLGRWLQAWTAVTVAWHELLSQSPIECFHCSVLSVHQTSPSLITFLFPYARLSNLLSKVRESCSKLAFRSTSLGKMGAWVQDHVGRLCFHL